MTDTQLLYRIRFWLGVEVAGLVLAGVTAFPLVHESHLLVQHVHIAFLDRVAHGLDETSRSYPFLAYGTDWLAFAHLTIAVAFWGPMREPVRNIWVVVRHDRLRRHHSAGPDRWSDPAHPVLVDLH